MESLLAFETRSVLSKSKQLDDLGVLVLGPGCEGEGGCKIGVEDIGCQLSKELVGESGGLGFADVLFKINGWEIEIRCSWTIGYKLHVLNSKFLVDLVWLFVSDGELPSSLEFSSSQPISPICLKYVMIG